MRTSIWIMIITILLAGCKKDDTDPIIPDQPVADTAFFTGMDLSYQSYLENCHVDYKDSAGNTTPNLLRFVNENGVNLIWIRLFHTPDPGDDVLNSSNLEKVIEYCKQIKQSGNNIMLDIHYSDTWADPGHQVLPGGWNGLLFSTINDSVYSYTKYVLNRLKLENALPIIVQIGNETNSGFLWNYGKVWNEFNDNWTNYSTLINSANRAIDEIEAESGEQIKSMIHIAGVVGADIFFNKLTDSGVQYDMIGLSHYHLYHSKDLDAVQEALNILASNYKKPIMLVETNYPFTLNWNDWTHNVVRLEEQLIPGYPATPAGQKAFYEKLVFMLKVVPNNLGVGFIWWAPDMVAFNGPESTEGSSIENLCVFDFENKVLPVLDVFKEN